MTSNIILLLSHLKSAVKSKRGFLFIRRDNASKLLLECLYRNGYISSFSVSDNRDFYKIYLKSGYSLLKFNNLRILSSPSRKIFLNFESLSKKYKPYDFFIISTSRGLLLGHEAFVFKSGGELLCDSFDYK